MHEKNSKYLIHINVIWRGTHKIKNVTSPEIHMSARLSDFIRSLWNVENKEGPLEKEFIKKHHLVETGTLATVMRQNPSTRSGIKANADQTVSASTGFQNFRRKASKPDAVILLAWACREFENEMRGFYEEHLSKDPFNLTFQPYTEIDISDQGYEDSTKPRPVVETRPLPVLQDRPHNQGHPTQTETSIQRKAINNKIKGILRGVIPHELEKDIKARILGGGSGIIAITAGPGMGKSSLIARLSLVPPKDCKVIPYFFNWKIESRYEKSLEQWLQYTCKSLIEEFSLGEFSGQNFKANPELLTALLSSLSESGQISKDNPLILLVDALDEMSSEFNYSLSNPLQLPQHLPEGAQVIYSIRSVLSEKKYRNWSKPALHKEFVLSSTSEAHMATIKDYITHICDRDTEMLITEYHQRRPTRNLRQSKRWFVETLAKNANYNFMIIRSILHDPSYWEVDTDDGSSGLKVEHVPSNIRAYFEQHMLRMTSGKRYGNAANAVYCFSLLPKLSRWSLLRLLGAETDAKTRKKMSRLIDQWVEQGLLLENVSSSYNFLEPYHKTFRQFLADEIKKEDINTFYGPCARNYSSGISAELDLKKIGVPNDEGITREWLELVSRLLVNAHNFECLSLLLNSREYWKTASLTKDCLSTIARHLHFPTKEDALKAEAETMFLDGSKVLYDAANAGSLNDSNGHIVKPGKVHEMMDLDAKGQFYRHGYTSFSNVYCDWREAYF